VIKKTWDSKNSAVFVCCPGILSFKEAALLLSLSFSDSEAIIYA
jgi:hypothetical protein